MCHPKGRSAAKDARSALTRRPARSYSAPTYPRPRCATPVAGQVNAMSGQFRGHPRCQHPSPTRPIAPQPTHTRLRRASIPRYRSCNHAWVAGASNAIARYFVRITFEGRKRAVPCVIFAPDSASGTMATLVERMIPRRTSPPLSAEREWRAAISGCVRRSWCARISPSWMSVPRM